MVQVRIGNALCCGRFPRPTQPAERNPSQGGQCDFDRARTPQTPELLRMTARLIGVLKTRKRPPETRELPEVELFVDFGFV